MKSDREELLDIDGGSGKQLYDSFVRNLSHKASNESKFAISNKLLLDAYKLRTAAGLSVTSHSDSGYKEPLIVPPF